MDLIHGRAWIDVSQLGQLFKRHAWSAVGKHQECKLCLRYSNLRPKPMLPQIESRRQTVNCAC
jgi:hypothetical protein